MSNEHKPYEKFTILENPNWKGTFLQGQFYVNEYIESLKGYSLKGLSTDRKPKLITRFILTEDVLKCIVIEKSDLLQQYINERK